MTKYTVEVMQRAAFEIREIYRYIGCDNTSAAKRIYADIRKAIADFADIPHKGSPVDANDSTMTGCRFVMVKPFLIFYKINDDVVTVYHVIDGRRAYINMLK